MLEKMLNLKDNIYKENLNWSWYLKEHQLKNVDLQELEFLHSIQLLVLAHWLRVVGSQLNINLVEKFQRLFLNQNKQIIFSIFIFKTTIIKGKKYVLEESIFGDFALIKAQKSDKKGNLVFNKAARNFNADMVTAAKCVIAEVEEIVDNG